ncbi:protein kinase family protein [Cohnella yongneupensis]|uniref:Protein kinase family protein n=1 Tax=Cohnella yongneupensis TaxID=425006 RepID=A0ABW0QT88_9BACL
MRTKWGNYYVGDVIGKGSFAKVYKAFDPQGRKLAIKVSDDRDAAKHEARIMQSYQSCEFLPRYYDYFEIGEDGYLVSEYIKGSNLGKSFHNTNKNKLDQALSVAITINILKGLRQLHKTGYIHDDVKPKNVMIHHNKPETVKLVDFNIAKKIVSPDVMFKELQDVCKMCAFLMNGTLPDIHKAEFRDSQLRSVLLNPFDEDKKNRYASADALLAALRPFL